MSFDTATGFDIVRAAFNEVRAAACVESQKIISGELPDSDFLDLGYQIAELEQICSEYAALGESEERIADLFCMAAQQLSEANFDDAKRLVEIAVASFEDMAKMYAYEMILLAVNSKKRESIWTRKFSGWKLFFIGSAVVAGIRFCGYVQNVESPNPAPVKSAITRAK